MSNRRRRSDQKGAVGEEPVDPGGHLRRAAALDVEDVALVGAELGELGPDPLERPGLGRGRAFPLAPRNLAVISALRRYGLAEDAGRGIDVMEDTMLAEMLEPPIIEDRDHSVTLRLPIRSAVAPDERAWIQELERRGTLSGPDRLVLVHAARGEILTNSKVREITQVDDGSAREILHRLRDSGFLIQRGERGGATYRLEGSLAPPAGLRLDEEELFELIEGLAEGGPITNADIRSATGLERTEVRALLASLVRDRKLVQKGERRGTHYVLRKE